MEEEGLLNQRRGKKTSITKRVNELERLVSEGGSRTKINALHKALQVVLAATRDVCEQLQKVRKPTEADFEWLEEVEHKVDRCSADVEDYLEERKNDAPSSISLTNSWVKRHAPGADEQISITKEEDERGLKSLTEQSRTNTVDHDYDSQFLSAHATHGLGSFGLDMLTQPPFSQPSHVTATGLPQLSVISQNQSFSGFGSSDPKLSRTMFQLHNPPAQTAQPTVISSQSVLGSQRPPFPVYNAYTYPTSSTSALNTSQYNQPSTVFSTGYTPIARPGHNPLTPQNPNLNEVDSWIDQLDPTQLNQNPNLAMHGITPGITMAWLVQQSLPRMVIPTFDGSPLAWVPFITKFRDLVHRQGYLNDEQRMMYLLDHLGDEAKMSVKGFAHDSRGYVTSLKRLKFLFGQKSKIAQANLAKVTHGKQIPDDNVNALVGFFYTVSDCLVTLRQLNYASDLYSTDTLRQAVRRLPSRLHMKWAEHCLRVRERNQEPNLIHFESWLQARVLVYKESYLPERRNKTDNADSNKIDNGRGKYEPNPRWNSKDTMFGATITKPPSCPFCEGNHRIGKCESYAKLGVTEKYDAVKNKRLCFNCLGHHGGRNCPSKNTCFTPQCTARHHTSLHQYFTEKESPDAEQETKTSHNAMVSNSSKETDIYLQVVPLLLRSPSGKTISTHGLLDTGSQSTLLREDIARKLNLKGTKQSLNITTVKDKAERVEVREVALNVASKDKSFGMTIDSVFVVPRNKFNMPGQPRPVGYEDSDIFTHIDGIEPNPIIPEDITILIGANAPEALVTTEIRKGDADQPLAVNTVFGWTLFGPSTSTSSTSRQTNVSHLQISQPLNEQVRSTVQKLWTNRKPGSDANTNMVMSTTDRNLHDLLEQFWTQEHCGILMEKDIAASVDDEKLLRIMEVETTLEDGHYRVPMLWKDPNAQFPNNRSVALKRFNFLKRRLRADPKLFEIYKSVIEDYESKGYARRMSDQEAAVTTQRTWYLPHHPVCNPNKPDKVRVVKDAAAVFKGASLNSNLHTGPDLLSSLVGVLIRFRTDRVAIVADIESMFHQVRTSKMDADSLRFLWSDNVLSDDEEPYTMQMLVHIFGAKDSPTCANYAVKRTARDNQHRFDPLTTLTALTSFYVDDLLQSVQSDAVAIPLVQELIEMMRCGGFHLTKFLSNSKVVMDSLPQSEVSPNLKFSLDSENIQRALGILWDVRSDTLSFSSNLPESPQSKRGILRITSSLFDPQGFVTPFVLPAKILLQELWRSGYEWDTIVDGDAAKCWEKWLRNTKNVDSIKIPRCYNLSDEPVTEIQLHIFTDASESAYGPVAYLRFSFKGGGHKCALVMSKSKLAPIKTVTLPRLELNAAVTGVRLYKTVIRELDLPVERTFFWTDSTLTLQYISNTSQRFKTFVANRVTEIKETTDISQWSHVPGDRNPADLLTRGIMDPSRLMEMDKNGNSWFSGPAFLQQDEEHWPKAPIDFLDTTDPEIKNKSCLVGLGFVQNDESNQEGIPSLTKFSNWIKLLRVFGWVLRFIFNSRKITIKTSGNLDCHEIDNSEKNVLRLVQRDSFPEELRALETSIPLNRRSLLMPLSPFVDDTGILRVGGRLKDAPIPPAARNQVILPKNHPVTKLIVEYAHRKCGHLGPSHVLADLHERYWIIHGRAAVKSITRKCLLCRLKRARREYPFMSNLPRGRLAYKEPPFSHCGVDLFGPMYIKQGRKRLKRWGVLFTCLTVRCIHLEVVESIDTDDFINSLRRFVNRRGCPKCIYSDCGTNFKGAATELKEAIERLDHEKIEEFATREKIIWKFNPPSSPHMGGAWERLVRSVKEVLTALMKDTTLTDAQLYTLMTEVENILNRRPLTTISDNIDDFEPLTPNHILVGMHRNWDYACETTDKDVTSRKRYRQVQAIAQQFWRRWRREYLPQLTKRGRWQEHIPNYEVGNLVGLIDDSDLRGKWTLGRITKIMPGNDNVVRIVEVRTKSGTYTRPVVKLCRLEDNDVRQGEGC